ncbi:2-hydroxyacid dehydrogenase [Primorskyibacter sp. S187A]|uniref:2-hydroxyacid dehydrogenase n=1 Tax=Primorskyibacter sp. S187A TaxID=3415130 RepID=UPI003C7D45E4
MINVLFAARSERWDQYETPLRAAFTEDGLDVDLRLDFPPHEVDYIVYAPNSLLQDFTPYTRAKAVLNLWAGVEAVVDNPTLTLPLARMVGGGLTEGMVEWVTGHTLRHHLGMDAHIINPSHAWRPRVPPLASERKVTILGLGALGLACANALTSVGFETHGWSRSPKAAPDIICHHGAEGLRPSLDQAQIVILLLPDTPATQDIMNAETLSWLAPGAALINPGRGPLIDDTSLIAALDSGQIGHATLDVFRTEPLPKDHPYWAHPKVTVTPHVASETRPVLAAQVIARNISNGEKGAPFEHLVDRRLGY